MMRLYSSVRNNSTAYSVNVELQPVLSLRLPQSLGRLSQSAVEFKLAVKTTM